MTLPEPQNAERRMSDDDLTDARERYRLFGTVLRGHGPMLLNEVEWLLAQNTELADEAAEHGERAIRYAREARLAEESNEKLRTENTELRDALAALVERLDTVHASDDYRSVWTCAQLHYGPYSGLQYDTELDAARAVLDKWKDTR